MGDVNSLAVSLWLAGTTAFLYPLWETFPNRLVSFGRTEDLLYWNYYVAGITLRSFSVA